MNGHDEDVLSGARPVVEVGIAQKVAGWALRVCGLMCFLFGGLGLGYGVVGLVVMFTEEGLVDAGGGLTAMLGLLIALAVMLVGCAMGVFGMMVAGSCRDLSGDRFVRWAVAVSLRNVATALGWMVLACSVLAGVWFHGIGAFAGVAVGVGVIGLGGWAGRWTKRVRGGENDQGPRPS